jgi:hypothetical protein
VSNLQVCRQVVSFSAWHLGNPIPSPTISDKIGCWFRNVVGPPCLRRARHGAAHHDRLHRPDAVVPRGDEAFGWMIQGLLQSPLMPYTYYYVRRSRPACVMVESRGSSDPELPLRELDACKPI